MKNSKIHDKLPIESTGENSDNDFVKRRRVVKGLASLPVILTLGNGAAQANASSHGCVTGFMPGEEPLNDGEGLKGLGCSKIKKDDTTKLDLDGWATTDDPGKTGTDGKYRCVVYGADTNPPSPYFDEFKYTIDQDGKPTAAPNFGNPLAESCACSFVGPQV